MRASGLGEYDLDTDECRKDWIAAMMTPEDEPNTVEPLPLDASREDPEDYMDARMNGATVEESADA